MKTEKQKRKKEKRKKGNKKGNKKESKARSKTGSSYDIAKIISYDCDLRKLKKAASDYWSKKVADSKEKEIIRIRLKSLKYISPVYRSVAFPILSKIIRIPYDYISVISAEDAALLSTYAHYLISSFFEGEYSNLFNLLDYAPTEKVPSTSKYKLGNLYRLLEVLEEMEKFSSFKATCRKSLIHDNLIFIVEETSKFKYINILNGEEMSAEPLDKVEADVIEFFPRLRAGCFKDNLEQIEELMFKDF